MQQSCNNSFKSNEQIKKRLEALKSSPRSSPSSFQSSFLELFFHNVPVASDEAFGISVQEEDAVSSPASSLCGVSAVAESAGGPGGVT